MSKPKRQPKKPTGGAKTKRVLTAEEDALFRALVKGGAHPNLLKRQLGLTVDVVERLAAERGLTVVRHSEALRARFIALWEAGAPAPQIAAELHMTLPSVHKRRVTLGLPPRRQDFLVPHWSAAEVAELRRLYLQGARLDDIAASLGRSVNGVISKVKLLGLRRGYRGRRLTETLGLRLIECLEKRGPSLSWRLRDYVDAPNPRLLQSALQRLARAGIIERVGPKGRTGLWRLTRPGENKASETKAGAELAPRPSQENDA